MKNRMAVFTFLTSVAVCLAQTVNISGVVKNSGGNAVEGAMVRLGKVDLSTATGTDGKFTLTGNITGVKPQSDHTSSGNRNPIILKNGRLFFRAAEPGEAKVMAYDCNGRLMLSASKNFSEKDNTIQLPSCAHNMYICRISMSTGTYTFRYVAGVAANSGLGSSWNMHAPVRQAKVTAPVLDDALLITKTGYQLCRLPVTNTDTSGIQATLAALVTGTVTDADGNSYQTVQFGKLVWTVENLRTTKYNDGSGISQSDYSFYKNTTDAAAKKKWGALYSASAALSSKLAPAGWHVATDADWDTLQNFLITRGYNYDGTTDSNKIAKSMTQTTDWQTSKEAGAIGNDLTKNNASGFSALPGGTRYFDGTFFDQNVIGYWWTSTKRDVTYTWSRLLYYTNFDLYRSYRVNTNSFSVRIVKNN